jgi:hypothetical protein
VIINYHDHGQPDPELCSFVERRAASLATVLPGAEDEHACLDVTVLYDLRSDIYTTKLTLQVAGKRIDTVGDALLRAQSIDRAFRLLTRCVIAPIEQLSRQPALRH